MCISPTLRSSYKVTGTEVGAVMMATEQRACTQALCSCWGKDPNLGLQGCSLAVAVRLTRARKGGTWLERGTERRQLLKCRQ